MLIAKGSQIGDAVAGVTMTEVIVIGGAIITQRPLSRADGAVEGDLGAKNTLQVRPGDVLTIETPGGGGWKE